MNDRNNNFFVCLFHNGLKAGASMVKYIYILKYINIFSVICTLLFNVGFSGAATLLPGTVYGPFAQVIMAREAFNGHKNKPVMSIGKKRHSYYRTSLFYSFVNTTKDKHDTCWGNSHRFNSSKRHATRS